MGAVYLAEHMVIGKRVALKVLLGNVAGNETAVARFQREAQAAGRIGNDHILEIFDFGSLSDGSRYMVCEFLEGETLADRLTREVRLSPAALVPIARQLLSGLGAAHAAGVVHRDLKPENIFILRQKAGLADFVKIIDFGISKFQPLSTGEGMQMTATGIVVGTPCYLSPEQARGSREADARSDLYAVGVILYECVSGTLPFDAQNINELLFKIVLEAPRPLHDAAPNLDPDFARIIEVAMARDPEHRFQSAALFSAALEGWAVARGFAPSIPPGQLTPAAGVGPAQFGNHQLPSGSTRSLAPTPQTWADSQATAASFRPPRRRTGLIVAAVIAALLVGGGAFALLGGGGANGGSATASSAVSAAPLASASATPVPEPVAPVTLDTVSPPTPDPIPPPVSASDDRALLEPPSGSLPSPARRGVVSPKRAPVAAPKKTSDGDAPAAPPATESTKRHRDFGY
jgi:serine/threonine-protein kinase